MIARFFSFRGRMARLDYFLSALGLGIGIGFVLICIIASGFSRGAAHVSMASLLPLAAAALLIFPLFIWISLALQAKRFRDIGWDPVLVIPIWIVVEILDQVAAHSVPGLGLGPMHKQTLVGVILNLALGGCLLFWPSRRDKLDVDDVFGSGKPTSALPPAPLQRPSGPQVATGFGRRGL